MNTGKEQNHFDLFKRLYHIPCGVVEHVVDGGPDFLIRQQEGILGIEHTEVPKKQSIRSDITPQQVEGSLQKIIKNAEQLAKKNNIPPLLVDVWFYAGIDRQKIDSEKANQLSQFLVEEVKRWCEQSDKSFESLELNKNLIFQIFITRMAKDMDLIWRKQEPVCVQRGFIDELQKSIDEKNKKYDRYIKKCDQCWLLIVSDIYNPAQGFQFTAEMEEHTFVSRFDKTFYMEVSGSLLKELKCRGNG